MRLLIIGGTRFLGRHLVTAAQAAGHEVTIFHRGNSPSDHDGIEEILGDRNTDLERLSGRTWDAVIDTCGYVPRAVGASTRALADACEHYTFVSSISAYAEPFREGMDEDAPVGTIEDPTVEEITAQTYGPLKALCEKAASEAMPGRVLIIRPGLIVGPYDPSERYTYWPRRVARGGELLAPGDGSGPVQLIDARDLASWMIRLAEQRITGTLNATGPPMRFDEMLTRTIAVLGSNATPVWVDEAFLREQEVAPWMGLPMWLPSDGDDVNMNRIGVARALAAGLSIRPLEETARDTLAWDETRSDDAKGGATITAERERAVLAAWAARSRPTQG